MPKRDMPRPQTLRRRDAIQGSGRESDDSLLARIGAGERDAWDTVVTRHLPSVTRYATYVLGDPALAEDVAQETFFRLIRKARDWRRGGATLRTWLFRVALNLCIDRKRARRTESLDIVDDMPDPLDDAVIDRTMDLQRYVRAAVRDLPERQQAAIVLVHYEGFSGNEAAEILKISVEALESLLARGRRTLRQQLTAVAPDLLGGK